MIGRHVSSSPTAHATTTPLRATSTNLARTWGSLRSFSGSRARTRPHGAPRSSSCRAFVNEAPPANKENTLSFESSRAGNSLNYIEAFFEDVIR